MSQQTTVKNPVLLFEFLCSLYPESPRTRIKKLLQHNNVLCNGKVATRSSLQLNPGDIIEIDTNSGRISDNKCPFPVLYEDHDVIVVEKPVGISTSSTDNSPNVYYILSHYLKSQTRGKVKAHVVHRLDKEVSGVLLFAKSERAMNIIKDNWKATRKYYFALVEGKPEKPEGTIESWLTEDRTYKVHSSDKPVENAKFSITHYRTTKSMEKYTLLEIELETGRKNQIRVHLSDIGCPIVGDKKYGAKSDFVRRVRLHSSYLSFPHPFKNETITVESPLPKDFLYIKDINENYK
jgi:23S rRNA pseudouridine1911/1915/1917 synthase